MDPLLASLRAFDEPEEMARLYSNAFVASAALPAFRKSPANFAEALSTTDRDSAFEIARARVAARLAAMVEAHRQVNTVEVPLAETLSMNSGPVLEEFPAPGIVEVNALYDEGVVESPPPLRLDGKAVTSMQLVPGLPEAKSLHDVMRAAETPPIAIAA